MATKEKVCGIYCIKNKANGKVYVGKSIDINHRIHIHINHLQNKNHPNELIQKDWDEYGSKNFNFEIIEECKEKELPKREDYHIKAFECIRNGYNMINTNKPSKSKPRIKKELSYDIESGEWTIKDKEAPKKKVQRAFYYDNDLIKIFDKHYPAKSYNKSEIMNDLLKAFLVVQCKK
jgi:group I intron endonuclease